MQLLLIALSVFAAGVPMTGFLALVWWLDRYEREPVWLVLLAYLWGAIGAIGIAMVGSAVLTALFGLGLTSLGEVYDGDLTMLDTALGAVIVAPLVEEPAKALFLVPIAFSRHFDNMTDGFVYGAAIGLGFGMTENLLYFVSVSGDAQQWLGTVVIRTFYSAVMHATATAAVGAGLGWGRFRGWGWVMLSGWIGACLAVGIHGAWNGLLTLDQAWESGLFWTLDLLMLPAAVFAMFIVFETCVIEEGLVLRKELREEVATGLIPEGHPKIIASWWRRLWSSSWVPEGVDKEAYLTAATALAMRKHQVRLLGNRAPDWLAADVSQQRDRLRRILG